jgi:hypothetical protein
MTLLIVAAPEAECRRHSTDDLCRGELRRESHDVLDAANRPPIRELGSDAIRVSSTPALGGEATIVEAVRSPRGNAIVAVYALYGHPRLGWRVKQERQFRISAGAYRSSPPLKAHSAGRAILPTQVATRSSSATMGLDT